MLSRVSKLLSFSGRRHAGQTAALAIPAAVPAAAKHGVTFLTPHKRRQLSRWRYYPPSGPSGSTSRGRNWHPIPFNIIHQLAWE